MNYPQTLDYRRILRLVPHKAPWMLIDRVVSWDEKSIVVNKAVSGADPIMAAHIADGPGIVPGVLYIELVAQSVALLNILNGRTADRRAVSVMGRCKGEFISPGHIGETLRAEAVILDSVAGKTVYEGVVYAEDRLLCKVSGMGALMKKADVSPSRRQQAFQG